jgi:hypothetical protein
VDRWMEGRTEGWMEGRTDGWMDLPRRTRRTTDGHSAQGDTPSYCWQGTLQATCRSSFWPVAQRRTSGQDADSTELHGATRAQVSSLQCNIQHYRQSQRSAGTSCIHFQSQARRPSMHTLRSAAPRKAYWRPQNPSHRQVCTLRHSCTEKPRLETELKRKLGFG